MPQGAVTEETVPATTLHAGDEILAARDRKHKPERATISQILKGSTGPGGHNFVACQCRPGKGDGFTINVPSEQPVTVLSRNACAA